MHVVIFGSSGQDGTILTKLFKSKGHTVFGVSRTGNEGFDVQDKISMKATMIREKPDLVVYLAARASIDDVYTLDNYNAMIVGLKNLLEIARETDPFHLVNFGSVYQFEFSKEPLRPESTRSYDNHYSAFRNLQESMILESSRWLKSASHLHMCHHESCNTNATNFSTKLFKYMGSILRGNAEGKLHVANPAVVREWADAEMAMKPVIEYCEDLKLKVSNVQMFNLKMGASVEGFINGFCEYNGIDRDKYFAFSSGHKKSFITDNENFEYSRQTQLWVRSFE